MDLIRKYSAIIRQQNRPLHFLMSRLLWRSGLCRLIIMERGLYRLRFFPTSLSAAYWLNTDERKSDERFLVSYLKKEDIVIDVGANIGALTLTASALVGNQGHVFAIEAHPHICGYLRQNVALNRCSNVDIIHSAVGAVDGAVEFSNMRADDINHVLRECAVNTIQVPLRRLDDIFQNQSDRVALLKVDVEGYEKFVFEGAYNLLKRTDCIYFELDEAFCRQYGYTGSDVLHLLRSKGFTICCLSGEQLSIYQHLVSPLPGGEPRNLIAVSKLAEFSKRTGREPVSIYNEVMVRDPSRIT